MSLFKPDFCFVGEEVLGGVCGFEYTVLLISKPFGSGFNTFLLNPRTSKSYPKTGFSFMYTYDTLPNTRERERERERVCVCVYRCKVKHHP